VLAALSTGHKIGLAVAAAVFVVFALTSAMLLPRFRPAYPGRGLPLFVLATIGLFAAMMTSVVVFGRESEEAGAHGEEATTTETQEKPAAATKVAVKETEFKISLSKTSLKPGSYEFDVQNQGKLDHDFVVEGPGVNDEKTPLLKPGTTGKLDATLKGGSYRFYCSVPGHAQAGMDVKVSVS
jgi:uncharacterized cupredoxin-like copper-binding protein